MTNLPTTPEISAPDHENFSFGDKRLNRRANKMLEQLAKNAGKSLPDSFHNRADYEGARRFFDNNLVSPEKILEPHFEATQKRCQGLPLVAVLQDSSDLDYDYLGIEEFHSMSSNVDHGFRIHPSLAITENGTPLGLIGYKGYTREVEEDKPKRHRNCLPIQEKESFRWLEGYRHADNLAERLGSETIVVSIADREGDIYEIYEEAEEALAKGKAHVIIRAQHNRLLANESDKDLNQLEKKLIRAPVVGEGVVTVNRGRKNERTAHVNYRAVSLLIKAPYTAKKKSLRPVFINAVVVSEVDPPQAKGGNKAEPGLYWVLLTTLPIETTENVRRIVQLYGQRWQIEVFFKVCKSGCKVNQTRLQTRSRIENLIAFSLLVAWRVMITTYLARECPDAPCTIAFTEIEWRLAYMAVNKKAKKPPNTPPTMREIIVLVATLGGYLKRKAPPGIITVWRGVSRLYDIVYGYELAEEWRKNTIMSTTN